MSGKRNLKRLLGNVLAVLLGNVLCALSIKLFLLPAGLAATGTTGIALLLEHLFGLPISATVLAINVIMLLLGLVLLGKQFALTTLVSSFAYPVALECFDRLLGDLVLTEDIFLCSLCAGLGVGLSVGIAIRAGASTGGTDIVSLLLHRFFRVSVSGSMYVIDVTILLSQALYSTPEQVLYGVFYVIVYTVVLDKVLMLGTGCTEIKVISKKAEAIRTAILRDIDRGCTMLYGQGGYSSQPTQVVMSVVSSRELAKTERLIHAIDPECFIILSKASEVQGEGFRETA